MANVPSFLFTFCLAHPARLASSARQTLLVGTYTTATTHLDKYQTRTTTSCCATHVVSSPIHVLSCAPTACCVHRLKFAVSWYKSTLSARTRMHPCTHTRMRAHTLTHTVQNHRRESSAGQCRHDYINLPATMLPGSRRCCCSCSTAPCTTVA